MPTRYSYQVMLNGQPGALITLEGDRIIGTAIVTPTTGTPAQVRESSEAVVAWYRKIREIEGGSEGEPGVPWATSLKTVGNSGRVELDISIGSLKRTSIYDPKTRQVTTAPTGPFEASVYSWLTMHVSYQRFVRLIEAVEATRNA
jgi:hypothetical protein